MNRMPITSVFMRFVNYFRLDDDGDIWYPRPNDLSFGDNDELQLAESFIIDWGDHADEYKVRTILYDDVSARTHPATPYIVMADKTKCKATPTKRQQKPNTP